MTEVKPRSLDIGRKGIPPSEPLSNLNICHLQTCLKSLSTTSCISLIITNKPQYFLT